MGYRVDELVPGEIYHICTRGVEQRDIFIDDADYERFVALLVHCLPCKDVPSFSIGQRLRYEVSLTDAGEGLVDLMCYCLMSNHIHLLIRENVERGTSMFMQRVLTGYARYFNIRMSRSGSLFLYPFKAVLVDGDDQLLHVSRYIHLNPFVAQMVKRADEYPWSSLAEYTGSKKRRCHTDVIGSMMSSKDYKQFVNDEADYKKSLAAYEYSLVDNDV